jgi:hypothetical protein
MNQNPAIPANAAKDISPHSLIVGTSVGGAILIAIVHALQFPVILPVETSVPVGPSTKEIWVVASNSNNPAPPLTTDEDEPDTSSLELMWPRTGGN